jgi:hypothetical protein
MVAQDLIVSGVSQSVTVPHRDDPIACRARKIERPKVLTGQQLEAYAGEIRWFARERKIPLITGRVVTINA